MFDVETLRFLPNACSQQRGAPDALTRSSTLDFPREGFSDFEATLWRLMSMAMLRELGKHFNVSLSSVGIPGHLDAGD